MKRSVAITVFSLTLLALPLRADEDGVPADLRDEAFTRYVDLSLVRGAITGRDPAGLADAALQLTEGERILFRSHRGLPAGRVFRLAIQVAGEKRDRATLDRLERAAKAQGNKDLLDLIATEKKLAGSSRRVDPALLVAADAMSVEALVQYRSFIGEDGRVAQRPRPARRSGEGHRRPAGAAEGPARRAAQADRRDEGPDQGRRRRRRPAPQAGGVGARQTRHRTSDPPDRGNVVGDIDAIEAG
jgi:hypothetical protein